MSVRKYKLECHPNSNPTPNPLYELVPLRYYPLELRTGSYESLTSFVACELIKSS